MTTTAVQPAVVANLDQALPCVCGYDLRGLPADGRCPECGRLVRHMQVAARVMPAVKQWQRRFAAGGVWVAVACGLWLGGTLWCLSGRLFLYQQFLRLHALMGPHAWPAIHLVRYSQFSPLWSAPALLLYLVGIGNMWRVPAGLPRRNLHRLLRDVFAIAALWDLALLVAYAKVFSSRLLFPLNLFSQSAWVDAAVLLLAGAMLAMAAATGGRRGMAAQIVLLFTLTAAISTFAASSGPNDVYRYGRRWWFIGPLSQVVFASFNVGTSLLLIRFATSSIWSRHRWWAWAGYCSDPDAGTESASGAQSRC